MVIQLTDGIEEGGVSYFIHSAPNLVLAFLASVLAPPIEWPPAQRMIRYMPTALNLPIARRCYLWHKPTVP